MQLALFEQHQDFINKILFKEFLANQMRINDTIGIVKLKLLFGTFYELEREL